LALNTNSITPKLMKSLSKRVISVYTRFIKPRSSQESKGVRHTQTIKCWCFCHFKLILFLMY